MAPEGNYFALLDDQDTEDVSEIVDSLKVEEPSKPDDDAAALEKKEEQKPKQKFQMDPRNMRAKPLELPRHVRRSFVVLRKEKKDEPKPQANREPKEPLKKEVVIKAATPTPTPTATANATNNNIGQQPSGANMEKAKTEGKIHPHNNGYHQDQRGLRSGNGYQRNYRNTAYGVADGYQRNNNDDGHHGGRGRGFQPRRSFSENNGNEEEGEAVASVDNNQHQQELSQGQRGQRYYGGFQGGQGPQGRGYHRRDGSKPFNNGTNKVNGDNKSGANASYNGDKKSDGAPVEAKEGQEAAASTREGNGDNKGNKDSKAKNSKSKSKSKGVQDNSENKVMKSKPYWVIWNRKTLKEYEASLREKNKRLEALKRDGGRKVLAEEEFGSMQIIGKSKEKKSEERKKHPSHSLEVEKVRKSMSIDEFLKTAEQGTYGRSYYEQRNYGRQEGQSAFDGDHGGHDGGSDNSNSPAGDEEKVRDGEYDAHIEDLGQFPALGSNGSA